MTSLIPYKDISKPSKTHEVTKKYLDKILKSHNYSIENITADALYDIFKSYKKKHSVGSLSNGTIRCLLSTIANYRKDLSQDPVFLNIYKSIKNLNEILDNSKPTLDKSQENLICNAISHFVDIFTSIDGANERDFNILIKKHKVKYYTGLAVILTLMTNMRSNELQQVTLNNLRQMMNNEAVSIKIKKRQSFITVLANPDILKIIMPSLTRRNQETLDSPLIKISTVSINKAFRNKLMETNNLTDNNIKYGIQSIRKVNTTILISEDSVELAQVFNRHRNTDTTLQYYDNKTYVESQLNKVMNTL